MRTKFIEYCCEIAKRDLSWGSSGNFSLRLDADSFLVTASGAHFKNIEKTSITKCNINDENFYEGAKPSVETKMHRCLFALKPEIKCIIHVHPFFSVLMNSIKNYELKLDIIPEVNHYIGSIAYIDYIKSGTQELAQAVSKVAGESSLIILRNHGIVAYGDDFLDTLAKVEAFEFIAKMNYYAKVADLDFDDRGQTSLNLEV